VTRLPHGRSGLVIAAIFSAAMSNLRDRSIPFVNHRPRFLQATREIHAQRCALIEAVALADTAWGVVLIAIRRDGARLGIGIHDGLTIASLVYGPMLGASFLEC